ncbi:MAG: choloylglycine hydrolase family protein [Ruminococcaceae bacterium]|nr:choloylglycine hydrolase family protein [Oscillospiraceae bacterium]
MCTALRFNGLFGRTLDLEYSYQEQVVFLPGQFPLPPGSCPMPGPRNDILGMAHVEDGYPLFYDGMNRHGLAMAALNFPRSAAYHPHRNGMDNIASFALIPWVLGQCSTVAQAEQLLERTNIIQTDFSPRLPATPLHWLVADRESAITVESLPDGLHLYPNPVGVLTNEPPFPFQLSRLNDFLHLSSHPPQNRFSSTLPLSSVSRGMGAIGLPGDWSSQSRFVRCAFAVHNTSLPADVTQFFHLMSTVEVPRGSVRTQEGKEVISVYTSCCDLSAGTYYYVTYTNRQVCAVNLHHCDPNVDTLSCFPLITGQSIQQQN